MCRSQEVSFAATAFLIVGGTYAVTQARAINSRYLPIALMPVFAGVQQFMEGNVWWGGEHRGSGDDTCRGTGVHLLNLVEVAVLDTVRVLCFGTP